MKWKRKARIQNLIAMLPSNISYNIYYFMQRKFGGLQKINYKYTLLQGLKILDCIHEQGFSPEAKIFLEIGTGRGLNIPIVVWLCGAEKVITVDTNPYLKNEIVFEMISYIKSNLNEVIPLFEKYTQNETFLERLDRLTQNEMSLQELIDMANIQCLAPADATCLRLPSGSIDYHISDTVFEHIRPETLEGILIEGKRLLRKDGLFIHGISLSDHFSHTDTSISAINFLQFDEKEWEYYAGNKYMYHNRMRVDDFVDLFTRLGLNILSLYTSVDQRSLEELRKGFPLDKRFKDKPDEVNATRSTRIVASVHES